MEKKPEKRGLGRGLSALMADMSPVNTSKVDEQPIGGRSGERKIPITRVHANPNQPRKVFDKDDLNDLSRSIAEKGIIQPLIVRPDPTRIGDFEIVAGERRWRAAQMAKVDSVPVLVRDLNDLEILEIAIIENIQRSDLNPVDEAAGYQQLMDRFGHTQEKLSESLGKSRSHIANTLRLLNLPDSVLDYVREGKLTSGHARALVTSDHAVALAREVIAKGLSVRQTEALAKRGLAAKSAKKRSEPVKDADTRSIEVDLTANLAMKVSINHKEGTGGGSLSIKYSSFDELDELCRILSATRLAGSN